MKHTLGSTTDANQRRHTFHFHLSLGLQFSLQLHLSRVCNIRQKVIIMSYILCSIHKRCKTLASHYPGNLSGLCSQFTVKREHQLATCIKSVTFTSRIFLKLTKAHYVLANIPAPHRTRGWAGRWIKHNSPALLCHGISIYTLTREQGRYLQLQDVQSQIPAQEIPYYRKLWPRFICYFIYLNTKSGFIKKK